MRPFVFRPLLFLFSVALVTGFISVSHAGFEWRGPVMPPAPPVMTPPALPTGIPADDMQDLAPVIMWDEQKSPVMPAVKTQGVESVSMLPAKQSEKDTSEIVHGFGSDLPLIIALRQIIPAQYQMSFSEGTDLGVLVSWQGDQGWHRVLSDTLMPLGLSWRVKGNTVLVGSFPTMPEEEVKTAETKPPRVLMGRASPAGVQMPPPGPPPVMKDPPPHSPPPLLADETVQMRRTKPSSLLEQLGFVKEAEAERVERPVSDTAWNMSASTPAPAPVSLQERPVATKEIMPAPTPVPVAAASVSSSAPQWSARRGQMLRDTLKEWSGTAGVELFWSIDYDYKLSRDMAFSGGYDAAVGQLLSGFSAVRPQPYGRLHVSDSGQRVLVIKSYDVKG